VSRPLRLELSGGLYHVASRGDRREHIFVDDIDREVWLVRLESVSPETRPALYFATVPWDAFDRLGASMEASATT